MPIPLPMRQLNNWNSILITTFIYCSLCVVHGRCLFRDHDILLGFWKLIECCHSTLHTTHIDIICKIIILNILNIKTWINMMLAANNFISIVTYYYCHRFTSTMECGAFRTIESAIILLDMRDNRIYWKFN